MSVADRNRLEAESPGRALPFEGDDRLQIPSGTDEERVRAIRRYWAAWPEHRNAVLEQYAEAQKRAADFRGRYRGKPPVAALKDVRRDDPSLWAALAPREYFEIGGGPLGVEMTDFDGNLGPVFFSEISTIAKASDNELRMRPPVRVAYGYVSGSPNGQSELFAIVAGESQVVLLSAIAGSFPTVDALQTAITGTRLDDIRLAYANFARAYWDRRTEFAAPPDSPPITTSPGLSHQQRTKQTFHPIARVEQAFAANTWVPTNDGRGLVHRAINGQRKKDLVEVLLSPLENPEWFASATVDDLRRKLDRIGANGTFVFAVTMSLAIGNEAIDLELDDFIDMLGLDPRSPAQRVKQRTILWECLQLFSQTQVIGEIQGNFRDRHGSKIERLEQSPMIALTGRQYPREMRFDKSETPIAVSFVAGNFFRRHRENRKLLADFGDLRALARIKSGQAAGAWARTIGLALYQVWRERAHYATFVNIGEDQHQTVRGIGKITRRELFIKMPPTPNPFTILAGTDPKRAQKYWDGAIDMLVEQKILSPGVSTKKRDYPRQAWADLWLDEDLDLRPHRENFVATQQVQAIADGAREFKRKRGRPKKV